MGGHVVSLGTPRQRRSALSLNKGLLTELWQLAHQDQKPAVELMLASTEHSFAMVEIEEEDFEEALLHTQKQLRMLEDISSVNGEHILLNPLETAGNLLSQLERYKEAATKYERAMSIISKLYGTEHVGLATLLMNCGISHYMHTQSILKKAWPQGKLPKVFNKVFQLLDKAEDMFLRCRRMLFSYESPQARQNLNHMSSYYDKVLEQRLLLQRKSKELFTNDDDDEL